MVARALLAVAACSMAACSLLVPLDDYKQTASSTGQGGSGAFGAGGAGAGGGADGGCEPQYASDKDACGEPGVSCEEGQCTNCMCKPHPLTSLSIAPGSIVVDFGVDGASGAMSIALPKPSQAIDAINVSATGWTITDDVVFPTSLSERILFEAGVLYFSDTTGIHSWTPAGGRMDICGGDDIETLDHMALGGSNIYRTRYEVGAVEVCLPGLSAPALSFASDTTDAAWEVEATTTKVLWTNRKLGGGVYEKDAELGVFEAQEPTVLFEDPAVVPSTLEIVQGAVYFTDCEAGELYEILPSEAPHVIATGMQHPTFMDAVDDDGAVPTFYVIETDTLDCAAPLPAIEDASLVRYRDGERRVLAEHIAIPSTIHVFGDDVYFANHSGPSPEILRVPR